MKERLIFQHIPKTAGTSLSLFFTQQFDRRDQFICGTDGVLNDFLALTTSKRDSIRLLIGHVDYGIDQYFSDKSRYVTFLREPIERVVSHFYYIRNNRNHRYNRQAQNMNMCDFVRGGIRPRMNNCMVRMLSGINPEYGGGGEELVDIAIANVTKHYFHIGFTDRLDESITCLSRQLGYPDQKIPQLNRNQSRPSLDSLPDNILDVIREFNALDMKLYKYFKSHISSIENNPDQSNHE